MEEIDEQILLYFIAKLQRGAKIITSGRKGEKLQLFVDNEEVPSEFVLSVMGWRTLHDKHHYTITAFMISDTGFTVHEQSIPSPLTFS